jgi:hypothetical protein
MLLLTQVKFGYKLNTVKTSQTETPYISKQRRNRIWLARLAILIGFGFLLYFGYCWGLWGRKSLLLQYLFQCGCPAASEEARYPKLVDVIIPACRNVDVVSRLSPSGRFLYIREEDQGLASAYFLDLQSMERIEVTDQPFSSFLTDDLWFVESGLEDEIIDRITGRQYPIQPFRHWRENAYINGEPNLELLISGLHQAEQVFLTPNYSTVVVLMPHFLNNPEQNFTFSLFDFPGWSSTRVEQFLRENQVNYQTVLANFPGEVLSPNGKFIARGDGIYLIETDQKIVEGYSSSRIYRPYSRKYFEVRGWTLDSTGVVYTKFLNPCLVETNFFMMDDTGCFYEVLQPVLKLNIPKKYLMPAQTPR